MNLIRTVYRRLDALQHTLWFRLALTVIVVIGCGAFFGTLLATTYSIDGQRTRIVDALAGQSLADQDEHAMSLRESGTATINGRTYGGPEYLEQLDLIFDPQSGAITVPGALAEAFLDDQRPDWAPNWLLEQPGTTWMLALLLTTWWLLIIWMSLVVPYVLTALATGLGVTFAGMAGSESGMWAFAGIGLLTFTFVLLMRAALIVLNRPNQVMAVAHTVVKEASRSRISLIFIVMILIMLPLIPLGLDDDSPLRFRIQTFISRSLGYTFAIAACMTLVLSCATVAFEIRDRQIWQLVTKPLSRFNYLLGKWLGVVTVNLIIMVIAAVSIFTFVQYLREQPVARGLKGFEDAQQVRDAVLTARVGRKPDYLQMTVEQLRARVEDQVQRTPELALQEDVPLYVRQQIAAGVLEAWAAGQRTIPPGQFRDYTFSGLGSARELQSTLTLRYRFHIMRDDEHQTFPALFFFNGNQELSTQSRYVPTLAHVLTVPSEFIQDDGTLVISIANLYQPTQDTQRRGGGALNFESKDFELLYKVGSFEANFVRAVIIHWVKLAFLSILGISCATFLSFPVACLTAFTVFLAGTIGPFLAVSLEEYYPPSVDHVDWSNIGMVIQWAFRSFIRAVAVTIVFLLRGFGTLNPTQSLVEGRLIPWMRYEGVEGVISLWKIGLLWSGLALAAGTAAIRKRQLAIYSGHG